MLQYQKLVSAAAWKAAKSCGLLNEIEDVIQEAWVAAVDALSRYNPEKGSVSTLIYSAVFNRTLKYYGKRESFPEIPENISVAGDDYPFPIWYSELDEVQKEIVDYTFGSTDKKTAIFRKFSRIYGSARTKIAINGIKRKLAEVV